MYGPTFPNQQVMVKKNTYTRFQVNSLYRPNMGIHR